MQDCGRIWIFLLMWLILAFVSATFLGFYDTSKKASLKENAVLPVLLLNTVFSTLIFSPFLMDYLSGAGLFSGTLLDTASGSGEATDLSAHLKVVLKSFIVLSSWICGYFGLKHLPLTIVGPINATRPVLVLVGAVLLFGEKLNLSQWIGVLLTILSVFLMSRSSRKESIDFKSNRWIWCVAGATVMGAVSGLYDKYIMKSLNPMFVQSWFNFYQLLIMAVICRLVWWPSRKTTTPFRWRRSIPLISIFICIADFAYFTALNDPASMISVVSLVRRSSVIISFICGVVIFKERNLKAKVLDLILVLLGMVFIWIGTR